MNLTSEWIAFGYERIDEQWQNKYNTIYEFSEQNSDVFDETNTKLISLQDSYLLMRDFILHINTNSGLNGNEAEIIKDKFAVERLASHIRIISNQILEKASGILDRSIEEHSRLHKRNNLIIIGFLGILILLILTSNIKVTKSISGSMKELLKGIHIIKGENLDFRFDLENRYLARYSEIQELSGTFNKMISTIDKSSTDLREEIYERKQAENVIRIERDNLNNIFNAMKDGVYIVNKQYDIQYANPEFIRQFGNYEDIKCYEYFHGASDVCTWCKNPEVFVGKTVQWEWTSLKNNKTYDLIDTPLNNLDGSISKLQFFRDITKRKKTEEELKASYQQLSANEQQLIASNKQLKANEEKIKKNLREKVILIQEIYHRTKNNMAVVSAMLSMQSRRSENEYVKSTFKEINNKIQAMSLVHQKLYKAKDLSNINLKDYVEDLVNLIMQSYGLLLEKIKMKFDLQEVKISIDSAVPLGLIINELVSNIFKHAFPENQEGEIFIRLFQEEDKTINLELSDNGIGFPMDFDPRKDGSMGFASVFSIAENQLKGEISVKSENGLSWQIKIKDDKYKERV